MFHRFLLTFVCHSTRSIINPPPLCFSIIIYKICRGNEWLKVMEGEGGYDHAALIRGNLEGIVEERACEASFA